MIKATNIYIDKAGGFRIYISRDIEKQLNWKDHEQVMVAVTNGKLVIEKTPEELEVPA